MKKTWKRRGEFVNIILAVAASYNDINLEDVEFNGIAGVQFDTAVNPTICDNDEQLNRYITIALKLGVPVEGLMADGEKWHEVVALCKEEVSTPVAQQEQGVLVTDTDHHPYD